MSDKYSEPTIDSDSFTCPNCETYAKQNWYVLSRNESYPERIVEELKKRKNTETFRKATVTRIESHYAYDAIDGLHAAFCDKCNDFSIWKEGDMIFRI